ncbi:RNA polymerase sigma factor [Streptomyces sp. NPDC056491]|uniref:RNA polymerase sigma factor n=1 Tax=Streptomyces sp. NPDC056491 TaxID=3345837 RepID=UPI0036CF9ED0
MRYCAPDGSSLRAAAPRARRVHAPERWTAVLVRLVAVRLARNPAASPSVVTDGAAALPESERRTPACTPLEAGFEEFLLHKETVRQHLYRRGVRGGLAEDLMSQVGMRYAMYRGSGQVDNPRAFLVKVTSNVVADHAHKANRHQEVLVGDGWDLLPLDEYERSSEDVVADRFINEELLLKVKSLPTRQRQVIVLTYVMDLSYQEAADELCITVDTLRRYHGRALDRLRGLYENSAAVAAHKI